MIFTSSWDDGYAEDLRIAELLSKYGLTGTFYVCPKPQHGKQMLTKDEMQKICERHQIGSHTLTHPKLTKIPLQEARKEISESKKWVEGITGKECSMFCYPKGDCNDSVKQLVKEAGYKGARTTEMWKFESIDPFAQPVSIQIMPFPFRKSYRPLWKILDPLGPLRVHRMSLYALGVPLSACRNWLGVALFLYEDALKKNKPFFHLYGHSHEVEKYGMWKDLEAFFKETAR